MVLRAISLLALALTGLCAQRIYAPPTPSPNPAGPPVSGGPPSVAPGAKEGPPPPKTAPPSEVDPILAAHDLDVGQTYFDRGAYPGALARFQDATVRDPTSAEAYCRIGDTQLKLKDRPDARAAWQTCLKLGQETKWAKKAAANLKKYPPPKP